MNKEIQTALDDQDQRVKHLTKEMANLRASVELYALLPDVFKHGPIKTYWQVKWDGGWTKSAPDWVWLEKRNPKRMVIKQGDVDQAILPEKHVPSFIKRPFKC